MTWGLIGLAVVVVAVILRCIARLCLSAAAPDIVAHQRYRYDPSETDRDPDRAPEQ